MLQIRFPYQFEEAYGAKYGGKTAFFPQHHPTITFSYREAEDELARTSQNYHRELMEANRKHILETIASKARFQKKYPVYPTKAPNPLPKKHIVSGARPSVDAVSQPSFGNFGSLATFPRLSGGVLKDYRYARSILDRRANQIRQQQDPAFAPPSEVLTRDEQLKLDLSSLLGEVVDAITAGSFTDMVYNATRKLVGAFIRTVPIIDDEDDLAQIQRTIDNALRSAEVADEPGRARQGIGVAREALDPTMNRRRARITDVLEKIRSFIVSYLVIFKRGTLTEKERILAVKNVAKSVGLYSFADFSSGIVEARDEPPPANALPPPAFPGGFPGGGGDDDEGGLPPPPGGLGDGEDGGQPQGNIPPPPPPRPNVEEQGNALARTARTVDDAMRAIAMMNGMADWEDDESGQAFDAWVEEATQRPDEYVEAIADLLRANGVSERRIANDMTRQDENWTMFDDYIAEHADIDVAKSWFDAKGDEYPDELKARLPTASSSNVASSASKPSSKPSAKPASPAPSVWRGSYKGVQIEVPNLTSTLLTLPKQKLLYLATTLATAGKGDMSNKQPKTLVGYIYKRAGAIGIPVFMDTPVPVY